MPAWSRFENWEDAMPRFVELAVEGPVLFVRSGVCKLGHPPKLERRASSSDDGARADFDAEVRRLQKSRYVLEKTFEAPVPAAAPAPPRRRRAKRAARWPAAARDELERTFFDRLRAAGIDPDASFEAQAGAEPDTWTTTPSARDANARATACLAIAEEVLGVRFHRTYYGEDLTGEHGPFDRRDPVPVPFDEYARFYRSPAHVFALALRLDPAGSDGPAPRR